jgi:hypothetical protein
MKVRIFLSALLVFFLFSVILISSQDIFSKELKEGKNIARINLSEPVYVETLMTLNPEIEAVSYMELNETVGYVNVLGGIGENFAVEDRDYEIVVSKDINLVLPS